MTWTSSDDLAAQVRKHWDSGRILADALTAESLFPLKLRARKPNSKDLSDRFEEVRAWVRLVRERSGRGYEIEWRTINHRLFGRNELPSKFTVPSRADALKMIGKSREAARFDRLTGNVLEHFPELRGWLIRRPMEALKRIDEWPRILAVLGWFREHPRPGVYLRQLDIPGVDTKFIEQRRGLLIELLDRVLPPEGIDGTAGGARGFNRRYGLAGRVPLVRFRVLDPELNISGLSDLSVTPDEFAKLRLEAGRVFITENEINGLVFPRVEGSIVIFGLGYGLDRLAGVEWLTEREIWYWGDIDTHGFAILNRLRAHLPHARSFLMDRATLDAHRELWGKEPAASRFTGELPNLTGAERALYAALRDNVPGECVRLEQEHVRFAWLEEFLSRHCRRGRTMHGWPARVS